MNIIRLPSRWRIESAGTGQDYGERRGWTEDQALDAIALRGGSPDFALWCEAQEVAPEDVTATRQPRTDIDDRPGYDPNEPEIL